MNTTENALLTKRRLSECQYLQEDDLSYLSNDIAWIESRAEDNRIQEFDKKVLFQLVNELHHLDIDLIRNKMYFKKIFNNCFTKDYIKQLIIEKRKTFIRNICLATVARELILRKETDESMNESRMCFLEEFPFLKDQEGTDLELTWLNRYARALKLLVEILTDKAKTAMINVAAHLQGSSVFTEYITGGANKPETQRRVDLHHAVAHYIPKRRPPRAIKKEVHAVEGVVKRGRGRPRKNSIAPFSSASIPTIKKEKREKEAIPKLTFYLPSEGYQFFDNSSSSSSSDDDDDLSFISILKDPFAYEVISSEEQSNPIEQREGVEEMDIEELLSDEFLSDLDYTEDGISI